MSGELDWITCFEALKARRTELTERPGPDAGECMALGWAAGRMLMGQTVRLRVMANGRVLVEVRSTGKSIAEVSS